MSEQLAPLMRCMETILARQAEADGAKSYTASLLQAGAAKIGQKVGEEAVELVIAAVQQDQGSVVSESADLLYHWCVLLAEQGVSIADVMQELARREGVSGLEEKASRRSDI